MATNRLPQVAEVNEGVKSVIEAAFHLHLLGLNARCLATKLGESSRGFSVLSGEWVELSRNLSESMRELSKVNRAFAVEACHSAVARHRHELIRRASRGQDYFRPHVDDSASALVPLVRVVADALRWCMLGQVIARAAKIESAWSTDARGQLMDLATEFESRLGHIVPSLRALRKIEGDCA